MLVVSCTTLSSDVVAEFACSIKLDPRVPQALWACMRWRGDAHAWADDAAHALQRLWSAHVYHVQEGGRCVLGRAAKAEAAMIAVPQVHRETKPKIEISCHRSDSTSIGGDAGKGTSTMLAAPKSTIHVD